MNRLYRKTACLTVVFALGAITVFSPIAHAAVSNTLKLDQAFELPSSLLAASGKSENGTPLLQTIVEHVHQFPGYVFESNLTTYAPSGKKIVETGKLYYKAPRSVRFEVQKAGRRSGSVVVRQADGQVRGEMGGLLGAIHLTLSPNSNLIKASNGYSVLDSDLSSLLNTARERLKGGSCIAGQVPGPAGDNATIIEISDSGNKLTDRIELDSIEKLPKRWALFNENKILSVATFNQLQVRRDLPDALFSLGDAHGSKDVDDWSGEFGNSARSLLPKQAGYPMHPSSVLDTVRLLQRVQDTSTYFLYPAVAVDDKNDAQGPHWLDRGPERLISTATKLEYMLDTLRPVGAALEATNLPNDRPRPSNSTPVSTAWNMNIDTADVALGELLNCAEQDKPDLAALQSACRVLSEEITSMQTLVKPYADSEQP